jgi:outer membrane receptor protein involved in Fe transport
MFKTSIRVILLSLAVFGLSTFGFAQSQALNGQIEGTVSDANGAVVPNASVTATNKETGTERKTTTDGSGTYKIPLLPLGSYRVTIEAANFKKLVRDGITLSTGQTATIDASLQAGGAAETVTIESDAPIADTGKIDVGRVMNTREVESLPLVSRNPYNYALLQANVTGRPNSEFGVPRINANGYTRRTNYQLDGNSNTQADRGGIRLMPISETFVSEVQLVTNGFSAEFGGTTGLIMNAVTPSGTNDIHGSGSYRFRRTAMSSRPFNISPTDIKPATKVDNFTGAIGGPIVRNRWHYYGGYEYVKRDLAGEPARIISITPTDKQSLITAGLPSSIFPTAIPAAQKVNFFILKTDAQLTDKHHLSARFNWFKNKSPNNIGGGINSLQRSIDFDDISWSPSVQLISAFSSNVLNEFRFQYAKRESRNLANANSGTGPSIVIVDIDGIPTNGAAGINFGSPENANTIAPLETMTQFLDNFTLTSGNHTMKVGGGLNKIYDKRRSGVFARYTFSNLQTYLDAKNGVNVRSYTNYIEAFGNPEIEYKSNFYNFFVQDDWKITPKIKLNYGVRYDQYKIPNADATSVFSASQAFKVDKNNFAPRIGVVYGVRDGDHPTIIRASAGIYFDSPFLDLYLRGLQNNGSPKFFNFNLAPAAAGSPTFPTTLGALPPGFALPVQSIETISPDFKTMSAIHTNFQIEQGLTKDISATVGFIHSGGRNIPVYRSINRFTGTTSLPDGRPIFVGTTGVRKDTRFNNILMAESSGTSSYNALTMQLTKRFSEGYQFSINYTISEANDNAPEQNLVATQVGNSVLSDPTNRKVDYGPSLADQRHTFVMSLVANPKFEFENKALKYIFNDNQIGVITTINSGERFNILSTLDLNGDGFFSDRPNGIGRNSGITPKQFNVDMRYSRFVKFNERFKLEAFAEAVNIFNVNSIFQLNGLSVVTDSQGNASTLPTVSNRIAARQVVSLDSRQFQVGFKFKF